MLYERSDPILEEVNPLLPYGGGARGSGLCCNVLVGQGYAARTVKSA